jgi:hypothetical protein
MELLRVAHLTRQSFRTYSIAKRPYTLWDNLALDSLSAHTHRREARALVRITSCESGSQVTTSCSVNCVVRCGDQYATEQIASHPTSSLARRMRVIVAHEVTCILFGYPASVGCT